MAIDRTFRPDDGKTLPCRSGEARTEYLEAATALRLRESRLPRGPWGLRLLLAHREGNAPSPARRCLEDDACQSPRRGAASDDRRRGRWRPLRGPRRRASARAGGAPEAGRRTPATHGGPEAKGRHFREALRRLRRMANDHERRPHAPAREPAQHRRLALDAEAAHPARYREQADRRDADGGLRSRARGGGEASWAQHGAALPGDALAVWRWVEGRKRLLGVELPPESPLAGLPRDIGAATSERDRVLSPAEVWSFWRATESEGLAGLALRLMLLTAARVREVTGLPSSEVNLTEKLWTLPAIRNKGARVRAIPLSPGRRHHHEGDQAGHERLRLRDAAHPAFLRHEPHPRGDGRRAPWQRRPEAHRRDDRGPARRRPLRGRLVLGHSTTDARVPGSRTCTCAGSTTTGSARRWTGSASGSRRR